MAQQEYSTFPKCHSALPCGYLVVTLWLPDKERQTIHVESKHCSVKNEVDSKWKRTVWRSELWQSGRFEVSQHAKCMRNPLHSAMIVFSNGSPAIVLHIVQTLFDRVDFDRNDLKLFQTNKFRWLCWSRWLTLDSVLAPWLQSLHKCDCMNMTTEYHIWIVYDSYAAAVALKWELLLEQLHFNQWVGCNDFQSLFLLTEEREILT